MSITMSNLVLAYRVTIGVKDSNSGRYDKIVGYLIGFKEACEVYELYKDGLDTYKESSYYDTVMLEMFDSQKNDYTCVVVTTYRNSVMSEDNPSTF